MKPISAMYAEQAEDKPHELEVAVLTLKEVINEEMENPEFKAEWDTSEVEFQAVRDSIESREMNDPT